MKENNSDNFVQFLAYLRTDQKEWLKQSSSKIGLSISYMLRQSLDLYIKEMTPKFDKLFDNGKLGNKK